MIKRPWTSPPWTWDDAGVKSIVLCALLSQGCASVRARRVELGAAVAALACDWGQTNRAASRDWNNYWEGNMLLGTHPSPGAVALYMSAVLTATVALGLTLPPRVASALLLAVGASEAYIVTSNLDWTGACGSRWLRADSR